MLKRVFVKINVVIIVVRVRKKLVFYSEYIGGADIIPGQEQTLRLTHGHHFVSLETQVLPLLIAEITIHALIPYNFKRPLHANGAVVSCDHHLDFLFRNGLHHIPER